jgi:transcription termination factor Rho
MTYDDHQLEALRAFVRWLSPMNATEMVDAIDQLNEAETNAEFLSALDELDEEYP